jgi:hypothetical protein
MKKIVISISDSTYEKLRLEAIEQKKNISEILAERIFHKPFNKSVEQYFEKWLDQNLEKIIKE